MSALAMETARLTGRCMRHIRRVHLLLAVFARVALAVALAAIAPLLLIAVVLVKVAYAACWIYFRFAPACLIGELVILQCPHPCGS